MACDTPVFCKKTREWRTCSHSAVFSVESMVDGDITRTCCCKQHKQKTITSHARSVNSIVTVSSLGDNSGIVETHLLGTVPFGPETESQFLEKQYEKYFDEYCLIGMYNLRDEDDPCHDEWVAKYRLCEAQMALIDQRLAQLN